MKIKKPLIVSHFWIFLFVLLVLAALGIRIFGSYGKDLISWVEFGVSADEKAHADAERWALESEALQQAEEEASSSSEEATVQSETSVETLRQQARESVEEGDPQALDRAYKLFRDPDSTPEDRAWALSLALDKGDFSNAARLATILTPKDLKDSRVHYQLVRGFSLSGQIQDAIKLADNPSQKSRDPKVDLLLAQGLVRSNTSESHDEATRRIQTLLKSADDELALEAMNVVAQSKGQFDRKPLVESVLSRLQGIQDLEITEALNLEYLRVLSGRRDASVAVTEAVQKYRENDLPRLLPWLFRMGQFQKIIDYTGNEEIRADPKSFQIRLRSLENLKRWDQIEAELDQPNVAMEKASMRITQSLVAYRLGDKVKARQRWLLAQEAVRADKNRNWFYQLSAAAKEMGNTDDQMESIIEGIKHPLMMRVNTRTVAAMSNWMRNRKDGERLLEIYTILLGSQPKNPFLLNNNAYLRALYGYATESDVTVMKEIVSRYPAEVNVRSNLGFVLLSLGKTGECLDTLDQAPASPSEFSEFGKAVYARALYDEKRKKEALEFGKSIAWNELSHDELKRLALPER